MGGCRCPTRRTSWCTTAASGQSCAGTRNEAPSSLSRQQGRPIWTRYSHRHRRSCSAPNRPRSGWSPWFPAGSSCTSDPARAPTWQQPPPRPWTWRSNWPPMGWSRCRSPTVRRGLLLMATSVGDVGATADRYARGIADRAPELATLDPEQADGRCAVLTAWEPVPTGTGWPGSGRPGTGWPGSGRPETGLSETGLSETGLSGRGAAPVPYSLVAGSAGIEPVVPLHLDEVAAVAAGMPLEPRAADVLIRLATRGDLAAALLDEATA